MSNKYYLLTYLVKLVSESFIDTYIEITFTHIKVRNFYRHGETERRL